MWSLDDLRVFETVMSEANFAAAARRLGVTRSAVSKAIRRLEDSLEAQLFIRSTHQITATDVGRLFFEKSRPILRAADDAWHAMRDRREDVAGTVRVSVGAGLGVLHVVPWLTSLRETHPGLDVDLSVTDLPRLVIAEGFDLVIRVVFPGHLPDSDLIVRRLGTGHMRLCVSTERPDLVPAQLNDLTTRPCVAFSQRLSPERSATWRFTEGSTPRAIDVTCALRADNGMAVRAAVLAGAGVGLLPGFLAADALADGRLRGVLEDVTTPTYDVVALRARGAYQSRATTLLLDHLSRCCALLDAEGAL